MNQLYVYTYPFPARALSQPAPIPTHLGRHRAPGCAPRAVWQLPMCLFSHTAVHYLLISRTLNKWAFTALLATRDEGCMCLSFVVYLFKNDRRWWEKELWNILSPSSVPTSPCWVFWLFLSWICCPVTANKIKNKVTEASVVFWTHSPLVRGVHPFPDGAVVLISMGRIFTQEMLWALVPTKCHL